MTEEERLEQEQREEEARIAAERKERRAKRAAREARRKKKQREKMLKIAIPVGGVLLLLILIFVTLFSLFVPFGKVLFSIGTWKITLGALISGLERSFLLIGMVFISQFMVDKNISLPGKLGFMVESIFLVYDRLVVGKISFKKRNIVEAIDEKLLSLSR